MSWRAAQVAPTCPDGCAPPDGPPQKGHQGCLRHRQLAIGKRSPEYQALRSAGLVGAGTATPRIDHPCPDREWGRLYYSWRHNPHRLAAVEQALLAPMTLKGEEPRTWAHVRCRSCPTRALRPRIG